MVHWQRTQREVFGFRKGSRGMGQRTLTGTFRAEGLGQKVLGRGGGCWLLKHIGIWAVSFIFGFYTVTRK